MRIGEMSSATETDYTPVLFDQERRLRAQATLALDLAATAKDEMRRPAYHRHARELLKRVPQSDAERLLLSLG
jgi:hypothetical protein